MRSQPRRDRVPRGAVSENFAAYQPLRVTFKSVKPCQHRVPRGHSSNDDLCKTKRLFGSYFLRSGVTNLLAIAGHFASCRWVIGPHNFLVIPWNLLVQDCWSLLNAKLQDCWSRLNPLRATQNFFALRTRQAGLMFVTPVLDKNSCFSCLSYSFYLRFRDASGRRFVGRILLLVFLQVACCSHCSDALACELWIANPELWTANW